MQCMKRNKEGIVCKAVSARKPKTGLRMGFCGVKKA